MATRKLAWVDVRFFPPGWEARLYGSQGWPPLRHPQWTNTAVWFNNVRRQPQ